MKINNQFSTLDHVKYQTNETNRENARDKRDVVKEMVQGVSAGLNDEVKMSQEKTQEMANAELEQKTAMMQSDVSSSSSIASNISVKQRELLQAIADGDYSKIKSLSTEIKSLVQDLKTSSLGTSSKYSDVEVPDIPNVSNAQSQNTNATNQATDSAQKLAQAQAQVNNGANALKGVGVAKSAEDQAKVAVQASNVSKLAKLKVTAYRDKNTSSKAQKVLEQAETRKKGAVEEKAQKLAETNTPTIKKQTEEPKNVGSNETSGNKTTNNNISNDKNSSSAKQQEHSNANVSHNPAQRKASNAYTKTQNNQQDNSKTDLEDIKAHPEKYASSDVVKAYVEELNTAKSMSGASMDNYFDITEKVLQKADKALKIAQKIGATDGSTESNSRLADAISDEGVVGSGDVPQSVIAEHKALSQQHKVEKSQKEQSSHKDTK